VAENLESGKQKIIVKKEFKTISMFQTVASFYRQTSEKTKNLGLEFYLGIRCFQQKKTG